MIKLWILTALIKILQSILENNYLPVFLCWAVKLPSHYWHTNHGRCKQTEETETDNFLQTVTASRSHLQSLSSWSTPAQIQEQNDPWIKNLHCQIEEQCRWINKQSDGLHPSHKTKVSQQEKKGTAYDQELSRGEGGLQIRPKLCTHTLQLFGPTHTLRIWFLSQWQRYWLLVETQ